MTPARLEMHCVYPDTIAFILLDELLARVDQAKGPDTDHILWIQFSRPHLLRVHKDVVSAAQINDAIPSVAHLLQTGMIARNQGMIQDDHVIGKTPDANLRRVQWNRLELWHRPHSRQI